MNFCIVEKTPIIIDDVYDSVKDEYLHTSVTSEEIRLKYGLSNCDWSNVVNRIKSEENLKVRPILNAKYYYKQGDGFKIQKKIDGVLYNFGTVPTTELAEKCVEECKKHDWDIEECYRIVGGYNERLHS